MAVALAVVPMLQPPSSYDAPPPSERVDVAPHVRRKPNYAPRRGLNLFWRTFIMIGLLLTVSGVSWFLTVRSADVEPRAKQTAQQISSLVNLTRAALVYSDAITRYALIKTLADEEGVRIVPREPDDLVRAMPSGQLEDRVTEELRNRLGEYTIVASAVNDEKGLWIGFSIDSDAYWLVTDRSRLSLAGNATWVIWVITGGLLSLIGGAVMAGIVNQPLKQLLVAIGKVHRGDFKAGQLDEMVATREIREVNIGFNRMAEQMAKVEHERALMLAGISHDLRTPLARLRLEAEMSVADKEAQKYMVADIEQMDAIIDKFMDYARLEYVELTTVQLAEVVQTCVYPYLNSHDMQIHIDVAPELCVQADEVELARVISNLIENARRYGNTQNTHTTQLTIAAQAQSNMVHVQIYDNGTGVPEAMLPQLTQPFFRADTARTAAAGSGLGLAIAKKVIEHMGGNLSFENHPNGGLLANIHLPRAK